MSADSDSLQIVHFFISSPVEPKESRATIEPDMKLTQIIRPLRKNLMRSVGLGAVARKKPPPSNEAGASWLGLMSDAGYRFVVR